MSKLNYITIGVNFKRLRAAIDLSQHELSTIIPISKRSIAKIELGNPKLSVSKLNILLDFYHVESLSDLSNSNFVIDNSIRSKLMNYHKSTHPEYLELLSKKPGIVYAIDYVLLPSNFLNKPKQILEIREYFEHLGWDFPSSSLTNALLRKSNQVSTVKAKGVKDINLYYKNPE